MTDHRLWLVACIHGSETSHITMAQETQTSNNESLQFGPNDVCSWIDLVHRASPNTARRPPEFSLQHVF